MKRLAVIGCGAIAESFHLPAVRSVLPDAEVILVDPAADRAEALAATFGAASTARSHRDVLDGLDGAIIASPHHTHVPIATELVEAGVAVLCEKPLGTTAAEVEALRDLAASRGVTVAVNQTRRFIPAAREVAGILASGQLGSPVTVHANEGGKFDWPAATPSMFGKRSGGRGLLLDIGAHVLDLMVDWFGADLQVTDYRDDSFGGSEASLFARLEGPECAIDIRLSWLAKQGNEYVFRGPRGAVRWGIYDLDTVVLEDASGRRTTRRIPAPKSFADLAPLVLRDFVDAVAGGTEPAASPSTVLPSMRLMDACYDRRTRFDLPWHDFRMEVPHG